MHGRKYMGIVRTMSIIGAARKMAKIFEKVETAGHAAEVEAPLKEM